MQRVCPHCGKVLRGRLTVAEVKQRDADRFWKSVTKTDGGCWVSNATPSHPYSRTTVNGRQVLGHVLSWLLAHGDVPEGKIVCHKCDVPKCVNPDHLFLGTNSENLKDMVRKARNKPVRGELNGHTLLSNKDAVDIRLALYEGTSTISKLATKYGLTFQGIWRIACGKSFAHVGGPLLNKKEVRKLSKDEVLEIRSLSAQGMKGIDLAARFSIHPAVVSNIITGRKRADVPML